MPFSSVLNVVLGLAVIYYALSLFVSYITSWIAKVLELRAKNLANQLQGLLGDGDNIGESDNIFAAFMDHPWIKSLAPKSLNWRRREVQREVDRIPPARFALTLLDIWFPGKSGNNNLNLEEVEAAIKMLPDGERKRALQKAINDSLKQLNDMHQLLEGWYDDTMANVSVLYKQKIRFIVIIISLIVTLVLGVDSVAIAKGLWADPVARDELANVAAQMEGIDPETLAPEEAKKLLTDLPDFKQDTGFSIWWRCNELNRVVFVISGQEDTFSCDGQAGSQADEEESDPAQLTDTQFLLSKSLGFLITWIAISQGSSFWYQILRGVRRRSDAASQQPSEPSKASFPDTSATPSGEVSSGAAQSGESDAAAEKKEEDSTPGGKPSGPERLAQLAAKVVSMDVNIETAEALLDAEARQEGLEATSDQIREALEKARKSTKTPNKRG